MIAAIIKIARANSDTKVEDIVRDVSPTYHTIFSRMSAADKHIDMYLQYVE